MFRRFQCSQPQYQYCEYSSTWSWLPGQHDSHDQQRPHKWFRRDRCRSLLTGRECLGVRELLHSVTGSYQTPVLLCGDTSQTQLSPSARYRASSDLNTVSIRPHGLGYPASMIRTTSSDHINGSVATDAVVC